MTWRSSNSLKTRQKPARRPCLKKVLDVAAAPGNGREADDLGDKAVPGARVAVGEARARRSPRN